MSGNRPNLTIQTASLWASGDPSVISGTKGPVPFDPFLSTFAGLLVSATLTGTPFQDTVNNVDAGDQVVFVLAIQNFGTFAYDLKLRDTMPLGFIVPPGPSDLTVQDGTGKTYNTTGNLFDPTDGLTITDPSNLYSLDAYSPISGTNVLLVTFTLQASNSLAAPLANVTDTGQIVSYAASEGGPNLAGSNATPLAASTVVQTSGIAVTSATEQTIAALGSGQTQSYDITVSLPEGTVQDLRITEATPAAGTASLQLVSAQIVGFGANLTASAPVAVQPDGTIALGTVVDAFDNVASAADQIVVRVTVANSGGGAGIGTLNTTVSAADPNTPGQRWSTTVTNTQVLAKPNTPPSIFGVSASQATTTSTPVLPFSALLTVDPDAGQTQTLTIHRSSAALGTLGPASGVAIAGLATNASGDTVLTGTMDQVQAGARALVFTPAAGATGVETFTLSLSDGLATATNANTTVAISPAAHPSTLAQFPLSPLTVLTSTPFGSTTVAQVQSYVGPLDNIQSQFLYDGAAPLAIAAQQSNMLISSKATATAVQVKGGANVIDMEQGSSFLVGGAGNDVFILHADQPQPTWNTIANFHAGDSITIYGFHGGGASSDWWVDSAGAPGWTGATLHMDLNNDKTIDSSLTFAGKTKADIGHFAMTTGNVAGQDYLLITTS